MKAVPSRTPQRDYLILILSDKLRHETDYDKFVRLVKNYLKQRAYD